MEAFIPLIVQLVSGAVGGNLAGMAMKNLNQGTLINSLAGIVGGGIGGQILSAVLPGLMSGTLDVAGILSQIGAGGVGGAILLAIVGAIRGAMGGKAA